MVKKNFILNSNPAYNTATTRAELLTESVFHLQEIASPTYINPAGAGVIYVRNDDPTTLYFIDSDRVEWRLGIPTTTPLGAGVVDVATDSFLFIDVSDGNASKQDTIDDWAIAMAGTASGADRDSSLRLKSRRIQSRYLQTE